MYVHVAGPMGCTRHLISLLRPIGYIYVWRWKDCFRLCLMVILTLSVYVWCGWLIVASMLDALACAHTLRLCLRPHYQHSLFIIAIVALLLSPSGNAMCCKMKLVRLHTRGSLTTYVVVQSCCYHCRHCATRYDSIVHSRTRPCCLSMLYATWCETHKALLLLPLCNVTLKWRALAHKALSSLPLCDTMWKGVDCHWIIIAS